MAYFHEMGLPSSILQSLDKLGFKQPTPIQEKTIPLALQGKDILGSAQTGTGKTFAFAIPLIKRLLENPAESGIVLVPTRELAHQVVTAISQLIDYKSRIRTALLIGGEPYGKQLAQLRMNPRIIVGTPGRIIDYFERRKLIDHTFKFLVLDETDRMFDMGFGLQLQEIISQLPTERQTLMFSATIFPKVEKLAAQYLVNPERISIESQITPAKNLKQEVLRVKESEKYENLLVQLNQREGSIIVFVKTKANADRLAWDLSKENHSASAIHGDLRQNKRDRVMQAFRKGRYRIMVATDLAARGLDVPHIQHVINYDLPQSPEDYIHRIGRTARAGAEGSALSYVSPRDNGKWGAIQRMMNPQSKHSNEGSFSGSGHRSGSEGDNKRPFGNSRKRRWDNRGFSKRSSGFKKRFD